MSDTYDQLAEALEAYDRELAASVRRLMAEAWSEGHEEGRRDEWSLTQNPYRGEK